jgi:hypothetical protein
MLSAQFDHAVIIVPSLEPAVRSFERLGFHVMKGGRTGPVHNALILFGDGTYLELTTVRRQNIADKRARLLRDGSWFWPRPRWRPDTPFCDVAS